MKDIRSFEPEKYLKEKTGGLFKKPLYTKIEDGIYERGGEEKMYVTALSFIQELEYGEGENASDISQYPLEDVLDKYYCHVSDFFEDLNKETSDVCYLEFGAPDLDDVRNLRDIIGKHVYNKNVEEDGAVYAKLIIE